MSTNIDYWEQILKNPTPVYAELFDAERDFLLSHIAQNSKVLDIGCGDGRNIETILNVTKDVIGIDNDPKAVSDAKAHLANIPSVQILLADVIALPFPENSFDAVTLMMTLVNFNHNKVHALKEMARVLKQDGKTIISVYSEDAFDKRMEIYKQVQAPIDRVEGTTVILDISFGANISEQFSKEEIETLAEQANLKLSDCKRWPISPTSAN
jgi:ubiquinone/menaquinone biosynthesis C-methylase UbiE